jgi:hypothetical protein
MTVSADSTPATNAPSAGATHTPEFGRTAIAILVGMVLLIVALTGILVETTWAHPAAAMESMPTDPGSFARR